MHQCITKNRWTIHDGMAPTTTSAKSVVFEKFWELHAGLFGEICSVQSGFMDA